MFALEILFKDGSSPAETIFIRRPQALIGASEFAHVVLEDMKPLNYQIRLLRQLGRAFSCILVSSEPKDALPQGLEGFYPGPKVFDLGPVKLSVTPLDSDLILRDGEAPDRAGVRVLRQASSGSYGSFPALVSGSPAMVISFSRQHPVFIGRSKQCAMRLDSADISGRHARVTYDGDAFWVEDLGSTNGTYVNGVRIGAKTRVRAGEPILIAKECAVVGVTNTLELERLVAGEFAAEPMNIAKNRYPVLLSLAEVAKPNRVVLSAGTTVRLGREPSSDMWLGAPHISRHHCSVFLSDDGAVFITDQSTNGIDYDAGRLTRGQRLEVVNTPRVLNFGSGVTVALCFDEAQERQFKKSLGAVAAFGDGTTETQLDGMSALGDDASVRISDVSKLLNRAGRKATAHHLKAVMTESGRSTRFMVWGAVILLLSAVAAAVVLAASILF